MVSLADLYRTGTGVSVDVASANDLLERAAHLGSTKAISKLGRAYLVDSEGLQARHDKALEWLTKAANRDDVDAHLLRGDFCSQTNLDCVAAWTCEPGDGPGLRS
jgi:TPR repeat protein